MAHHGWHPHWPHRGPQPEPVQTQPVTPVTPPPTPVTPTPPPATPAYTFADEFDGAAGTGIDTTKWVPQLGQGIWGTGEVEDMVNSLTTAHVDGNSNLVVSLASDGKGGFIGARLQSKFSQGFSTTGTSYWEVRAQVPNVAGAWPAIWFMGNNGQWPANGEADMIERYGPNVISGDYQTTIHSSGSEGQPSKFANIAADNDWHIFRMVQTEGQLVFSVDGVAYLTVDSSQFASGEWPFDNNGGMYIILNVAAGGTGTDEVQPEAAVLPVEMLVDYVHAWV
jgi:beta-glucanase (GH16 family)